MHWSAIVLVAGILAISGCVDPKGSLSELVGEDFGSGLMDAADQAADNAAGAATIPVIGRDSPSEPAPAETPPEPPVEQTTPPSDPPSDPPADQADATDQDQSEPPADPADPAPADPPADPPAEQAQAPRDCVASIHIDTARDMLATQGHPQSAAKDQGVNADYDIDGGALGGRAIVDSGIAVGNQHSDDFCQLQDAYPCVFGNGRAVPEHSRHRWTTAFGFTNVTDGVREMAYNGDHQKFYETPYVVRGWVLLDDGTLVLEPHRDVAGWGEVTSSTHTNSVADRDPVRQFCDVNATGLLPEALARAEP